MVKVDLITGFLGSGKTTFIKKYARYLMDQGYNIGILENDFGAVNVDMMLLRELESEQCELEMVAGGCDKDCHRRRFKTKLIAMGMCGYDRVLIEPSGIFDMDEFFDALHEEPLDRWYQIGNVIAVVDVGLDKKIFLFAIFLASFLFYYFSLVGWYDFLYPTSDFLIFCFDLGIALQILQLLEEFCFIKVDWLTDMNQLIRCLLHALFLHQKLFVKLLTGT